MLIGKNQMSLAELRNYQELINDLLLMLKNKQYCDESGNKLSKLIIGYDNAKS